MSTAVPGHRIRAMVPADLDDVFRIESDSFATPWTRDQFLVPIGGEGLKLSLVLEVPEPDGSFRIAGFASAWVVAGEMQINNFAVAPGNRRQGLGARILSHLLGEAARLKCSDVSLEVSCANNPAIRMYEAGGFRKVGVRKGYYRSSGQDALILTRLIGIVF